MSWAWDHLVALLKRIWDDFVEFLGDFFIGTMKLFLTAVSAIVNAIPVPSFLANGTLGDYLNGIDPAVLYFLSQSGMAAGMTLIGAGVTFRLTRKLFTLGQW